MCDNPPHPLCLSLVSLLFDTSPPPRHTCPLWYVMRIVPYDWPMWRFSVHSDWVYVSLDSLSSPSSPLLILQGVGGMFSAAQLSLCFALSSDIASRMRRLLLVPCFASLQQKREKTNGISSLIRSHPLRCLF